MQASKSLRLAWNILVHSKLRSWLTIIGIVIGVAAVVAIVSIGEGLQQSVQSRLSGLGEDMVTISPGGGRASGGFRGGRGGGREGDGGGAINSDAENLTKKDILVLRGIEEIDVMQGIVSSRGEVYYLSEKASVSIDGVDPQVWKDMTPSELGSGRMLGPADYNAVIVGSRIAKETFKQELILNRVLTIEGKSFKIVGILKESGAWGGDDRKVIMPIRAARDTLEDVGDEKFDSIVVKVKNSDDVDSVMLMADTRLKIARHVTDRNKDYSITSAKATQERLAGITESMTVFLGAIAAVSLLVGAVGIANTMFTSVLEKTKEIGIMKAIGAKNKDIMMIFMFNSGMVGMVGGLLGIGLGSAISSTLPLLGLQMIGPGGRGMVTVITPGLLLFALGLSICIGMAAGLFPAYRASKLKPVDALRYE